MGELVTDDLELVVEFCPQSLLMAGGQIIAHEDTKALLSNEPLMLQHGLEKPHILAHLHHQHHHPSN